MLVCYFIATIGFFSSLVAAMSPSAAFSSALEALNMVDVHSFISFMVSFPKEVAHFFQAVLDGFRLSISESPRALPVLSIDSAGVARCNASVEISAYIKAPVHSVVATLAKASSSKPFHHLAPEKIVIVPTSSQLSDPSLGHCEDMIMMLFIVAACFCLIRTYAYLRRIASCAFRNWQKANASSLVIMPDNIQLQPSSDCEDEIACAFAQIRQNKEKTLLSANSLCYPLAESRDPNSDTPTLHHVSQMLLDSWTSYSADESILRAIFLDTVDFSNEKLDVLDSPEISSVSSDTSDSSLEEITPKEGMVKPVYPTRKLLASLKEDFDMAATRLGEMRREPNTGITTDPKVTTGEAAARIQNCIHYVDEFERSITESLNLMSWVQDSLKFVGKTEVACDFQNRKAPQLQKRVKACFKLFQTKFGFDETGFFSSMRGAHALSQCFALGSCPKIQHSQIKEAHDELRQFLSRKGILLSSLLDECLDTVRECEELRKSIAEFVLKI